MQLPMRSPAPLWLAAAATAALGLLTGLWLVVEWLLEGLEEARSDWWEHFWVGACWVGLSSVWLAWRRPASRGHALLTILLWAALVYAVSLTLLFRFLAEDFGLPARVSGMLVAAMAAFLVVYQLIVAALPAALLQAVLFKSGAERRRIRSRSPSSPTASS